MTRSSSTTEPSVSGERIPSARPDIQIPPYDPGSFEDSWRETWEREGIYRTREIPGRPKFYCLDFFPYPSGEGLSVGHCRNYIPTDAFSRFMRMRGYNVLHPMGWDAFGEPTENKAIELRQSPRLLTDRFTANYKRQMRLVGISFDWSREIDSSKPDYYRWTQWFFLLLYKRGLAYRATNWQWWCPVCQTTLSNQEVHPGPNGQLLCWRDHPGVIKKQIPAWFFRITAYADQLLDGLREIDWPARIKLMQENWIGRSEGVEIVFRSEQGHPMPVFTTRPDTVFGVTFVVIAPEHELVRVLTTPDRRAAVEEYIDRAARASEIERMSTEREKTGVFTGAYVINPLNGERVPLFVADYVLHGYGTGIVMGVPGHDQRDFEFAHKYGLPIKVVIAPPGWSGEPLPAAYTGPGHMVNSGEFDGLPTPGDWLKLGPGERQALVDQWHLEASTLDRIAAASDNGIAAIGRAVEERGIGRRTVSYRMRDWLISRQRYWGAPIPIVYCERCGEVPVPEEQLPVVLPEMDDIAPSGDGLSPLARAADWVNTTCPRCGAPARRETDTMGGFACSSWYYLRFTSPDYQDGPFDPARMRFWMPVDLYVGGAEHAVMHLLYARFWYKVMHDAGLGVPGTEPFRKLLNQGMVLAPDGQRMSKSKGNVITPDEMVARYGADSLRVYELFMAPFEQDVLWSDEGINGARRFLGRVWDLILRTHAEAAGERFTADDPELTRLLHQTIRRTTRDLERFHLNTMIAGLMEFTNALTERYRSGRWRTRPFQEATESLLLLLAPAAPFLAEELWHRTGHTGSIHQQPWPSWDEELARERTVTIVVQVNGRVRDRLAVEADTPADVVQSRALALPKIRQYVADPSAAQVIYVPGRIINIVTR
jgi:leucyl-tRNA synthetase